MRALTHLRLKPPPEILNDIHILQFAMQTFHILKASFANLKGGKHHSSSPSRKGTQEEVPKSLHFSVIVFFKASGSLDNSA